MNPTDTPNNDALFLVQARNAFYKKKFYLTLIMLILSVFVITLLALIVLQIYHNSIKPLYFIANQNSYLIEEPDIRKPLPSEFVTAWVTEAVQRSNSFDFVNYRRQLQSSQKYFLDFAWAQYMKGLTASNNLLAVINNQEIWITKVLKSQVENAREISGSYAWRLSIIVKQTRLLKPTYEQKPATSQVTYYRISLVIQRMSLLQSYKGLAILSMIKEPLTEMDALRNA